MEQVTIVKQALTESFYLTGATILGIGLVCLGVLAMTLWTDTRTYYQIRGICHQGKWEYTMDKMIKYGKPDDTIDDENYLEIWFREKQQAEAYLLTLRNQNNNQTPDP